MEERQDRWTHTLGKSLQQWIRPRAVCMMLCNEDCVPAWPQTTCLMQLECFAIPGSAGRGHWPLSPVYSARRAPCHGLPVRTSGKWEGGRKSPEPMVGPRSASILNPAAILFSSLIPRRTQLPGSQNSLLIPTLPLNPA